jgi:hypothetical protein
MKRKVKRYNGADTSVVEEPSVERESDSERRSRELLADQGRVVGEAMAPRRTIESYVRQGARNAEEPAKEMTRGQAFAAARRRGDKTFEYDGKRYTTELAGEKSSRSSKYGDVVKGSELGSQDFSVKAAAAKKEGSSSSAVPVALGGAGVAALLAKAAIGRGDAKKESLADRVKAREGRSQSGSTVGKMPGTSLNDPSSMNLGSDLDPRRTLRSNKRMGMDSGDTEFKKGGKVSSASSRADGIAQRGKTRGRIC